MVVYVITNLITCILITVCYFVFEKSLSKRLLPNFSILFFYKYFLAPLTLFAVNLLLLLIFSKELWFFSLIPLSIPVINLIYRGVSKIKYGLRYDVLSGEITPKIIQELEMENFNINKEDLTFIMYKQMKQKRVDITINSERKDDDLVKKIIGIERKINKEYADIIINLFLEKKRNIKLI
ncbi:hypothetical protein V7068_21560 [Bacillus sp. JJ634]